MIDLFKDDNVDDIIKQSIQVHDMVLEKILSKKYVFMIGNKSTLLDFIEDFELDTEPLQINEDNMMSLKREGGGFQHTYFVKKDDNLRHAMNIHGCKNPKSIKTDFDLLIGFELDGNDLRYLAFKKEEEFNVKNVERYINFVYPIAKVEEIEEFNKIANEIMEHWLIDSIENGTITIESASLSDCSI